MRLIQTCQSLCRFGLAWGDITPPVGIYHRMWGAATHDRSTGVHRPLMATAVALRALDGKAPLSQNEQILIALDHCLLGTAEMQLLLDSASQLAGVNRDSLLVVFSHTHSAGLMGFDRESLPGGELIREYLNELASTVAELVSAARNNSQPATIVYGFGRCALARNRDLWDEEANQFVCGYNPDGPSDDTLLVARVTGQEGELLASIVNYACHPTTLAWQNTLISPDYPGAMREVVEQATGAPCLFIQGASGELGPKEGYVGNVEVADRNGRQLGYAALSAICGLPAPDMRFQYTGPVVSGATLGTWSWSPLPPKDQQRQTVWQWRQWTLDLPYRSTLPTVEQAEAEFKQSEAEADKTRSAGDKLEARDLRALSERRARQLNRLKSFPPGKNFPYPIWLWRMGDAFWLAVEGEPYNLLQRSLRDRFEGVPIVVCSLANGSRIAYLPPTSAYGTGLYQETAAYLAPGCLERVIDEVGRQIESWLAGAKSSDA